MAAASRSQSSRTSTSNGGVSELSLAATSAGVRSSITLVRSLPQTLRRRAHRDEATRTGRGMQQLTVTDDALDRLRDVFVAVEGTCEAWTDEEVVRRVLIRGAMDYAKAAGREWTAVQALATALRGDLSR
jgi:hypothetical protein